MLQEIYALRFHPKDNRAKMIKLFMSAMTSEDTAYLSTFAEPGNKTDPESYLDSMFASILFDESLRDRMLNSRDGSVPFSIKDALERPQQSSVSVSDMENGVAEDGSSYYFRLSRDTDLDDIEALLEDRVEDDRREKRSFLDTHAESVDGWVLLEGGDNVPYPNADNSFGADTSADIALLRYFLQDRVGVKRSRKQVETVVWDEYQVIAFESYEYALNSDTFRFAGISDADIVGVVAKGPKFVYDLNVVKQLSDFFTNNDYDPSEVARDDRFYENLARSMWKHKTKQSREENAQQLRKVLIDAKKKDALLTSLVQQFWNSDAATGANRVVFSPMGWVASRRTRKRIADLRAKR
jgi:hypothetical protein